MPDGAFDGAYYGQEFDFVEEGLGQLYWVYDLFEDFFLGDVLDDFYQGFQGGLFGGTGVVDFEEFDAGVVDGLDVFHDEGFSHFDVF